MMNIKVIINYVKFNPIKILFGIFLIECLVMWFVPSSIIRDRVWLVEAMNALANVFQLIRKIEPNTSSDLYRYQFTMSVVCILFFPKAILVYYWFQNIRNIDENFYNSMVMSPINEYPVTSTEWITDPSRQHMKAPKRTKYRMFDRVALSLLIVLIIGTLSILILFTKPVIILDEKEFIKKTLEFKLIGSFALMSAGWGLIFTMLKDYIIYFKKKYQRGGVE